MNMVRIRRKGWGACCSSNLLIQCFPSSCTTWQPWAVVQIYATKFLDLKVKADSGFFLSNFLVWRMKGKATAMSYCKKNCSPFLSISRFPEKESPSPYPTLSLLWGSAYYPEMNHHSTTTTSHFNLPKKPVLSCFLFCSASYSLHLKYTFFPEAAAKLHQSNC